jgi:hypothetical protein
MKKDTLKHFVIAFAFLMAFSNRVSATTFHTMQFCTPDRTEEGVTPDKMLPPPFFCYSVCLKCARAHQNDNIWPHSTNSPGFL